MIIFVIFILTLLALWFLLGEKKDKPAPWGLPILGHIPFLGKNPCLTIIGWKVPLVFLRFGTLPTVVINDGKWMKEILLMPEAQGCGKLDHAFKVTKNRGFFTCGPPKAMEQRQFTLKTLKNFGYDKEGMEGRIQDDISLYLNHLGSQMKNGEVVFEPKNFFNVHVLNSLWDIIMGSRFDSTGQNSDALKLLDHMEWIKKLDSVFAKLSMFMPWLSRFLNWSGLSSIEQDYRNLFDYMAEKIEEKKKTWIPGHPRDFTDAYLDQMDKTTDSDSSFHPDQNFLPYITGDIFVASIESVATSMEWCLLYMATNLDVQKKLHQEIDTAIQSFRLPCLKDRPQMPYTEAVLTELLRISSIIAFGVMRSALVDITFHGHKIKKDTAIISNLYGLHHDPTIWPEPDKFRPDRFLVDGKFQKPQENYFPFGTGRRACLGESLGRAQLFLHCTSFFQKFSVFPPKKDWKPSFEPSFGFVLSPLKFQVVLKQRCPTDNL